MKHKEQEEKHRDKADAFSSSGLVVVSALEKGLRFTFMEELMDRARNRDSIGVSDVIYDMIAAGLSPGPRAFHGLVVAHVLNGDEEGAVLSMNFQFLSRFLFRI